MNEKYEINLVDSDKSIIKNSKKKDLNNKNMISISESLINIISKILINTKEKISKILVIGFNLNQIYNPLSKKFSNAQFLIADLLKAI